jgi:hypothetical protein
MKDEYLERIQIDVQNMIMTLEGKEETTVPPIHISPFCIQEEVYLKVSKRANIKYV